MMTRVVYYNGESNRLMKGVQHNSSWLRAWQSTIAFIYLNSDFMELCFSKINKFSKRKGFAKLSRGRFSYV